MQFEKLDKNKIRITLNIDDLQDKNIDFHSFMSNPIASQSLFFDLLKEAKEKIGFNTNNYQIKIEVLAISSGEFILTITRFLPEANLSKSPIKKNLKCKRKFPNINVSQAVYLFDSFDDFFIFMKFIKHQNINIKSIARYINLYKYKNNYYLALNKINNNFSKEFNLIITEFATYINNSEIFIRKLNETGNIIIKNNAISNYINSI